MARKVVVKSYYVRNTKYKTFKINNALFKSCKHLLLEFSGMKADGFYLLQIVQTLS